MKKFALLLVVLSSLSYAIIPWCPCTQLIKHKAYETCYSDSTKLPKWVMYTLTRTENETHTYDRKNNFQPDPVLKNGITTKEYTKSGYDRGHMAPADDFRYDELAESECFYMSNICPQTAAFNRGAWKILEAQIRKWVILDDTSLTIITGPILGKESKTIGEHKVFVPEAFYKIIFDSTYAIGFIMPNSDISDDISKYIVHIEIIEQKTGIDFRPIIGNKSQAIRHWGFQR